jgi:hypothetical protein
LDLQSLKKDYRLSDLEYLYVISPYSISAGVGGSYYYAREKNYGIYAISGDITKRTSGYVFHISFRVNALKNVVHHQKDSLHDPKDIP